MASHPSKIVKMTPTDFRLKLIYEKMYLSALDSANNVLEKIVFSIADIKKLKVHWLM